MFRSYRYPAPHSFNHQGDLTCHLHYCNQGFFQDFDQGGLKCDVMDYWGAKLYYLPKLYCLPQSKVYDKLGKLRIRFIVQSTISMHSMLILERSGDMPVGKFGKMDVQRLNLRPFQSQNIYIKGNNLKKQIKCENERVISTYKHYYIHREHILISCNL